MRYVELGRAIRKYIQDNGLTQKEMAQRLGTTSCTLTDWTRNGVTEKKAPGVAKALGIPLTKDYECEVDYVSLREASKRLGMSERLLQLALQQDKFNFGIAVGGSGKKSYRYFIYRRPFEEFMEKVKKPQNEAQNENIFKEIIS